MSHRALKYGVLISFLLLAGGNATASINRHFTVIGLGQHSCGKMVEAERSGDQVNYSDCMTGAITGYNLATGGQLAQGMDFEAIAVWVKNYCKAHPLNPMAKALIDLVDELKGRK